MSGTKKVRHGQDRALQTKAACHGERAMEQTFEKGVKKLMSKENVPRSTKSM